MKNIDSSYKTGTKTGVRTIFSIEYINGKSATNHSYFKHTEQEVILMSGSFFTFRYQSKTKVAGENGWENKLNQFSDP